MNQKRLLYVLLPAVLLIWGIIIHRILQAVGGEDTLALTHLPAQVGQQLSPTTSDTITLLANYPDPFLNSSRKASETGTTASFADRPALRPTAAVKVSSPPPASIPPFPEVVYLGLIQNGKSSRKVALLKIAGKEYFMEEKRQQDGIILSHIYPDSIRVAFNKEGKIIKLFR